MTKQQMQNHQTASMEDYLEAVAMLRRKGRPVRVSQLSRRLTVRMPSVSSALRKLSEQGLVEHERYGYVKLTPEGEKVAREVIRRHDALTCFFAEALGIDQEIAEKDACRIEHVISPPSLERVIKFIEFIKACPLGGDNFPTRYKYYLEHGELPGDCSKRSMKTNKQRLK
ncbi:MAG: metal-dependent transcriptional regulator [Dehalococcoidia bacterium]